MTAVVPVSQKEMKRQTGMGRALGYSLPKEDKILVRKDLPDDLRKEVLAHEEEHITKGEEGPFLSSLISGVGSFLGGPAGAVVGTIGGALLGSSAAGDAADAQVDAANQEIAYARETRDLARGDQAPYISAGHTALQALMDMTGLSAPRGTAVNQPNPQGVRQVNARDYLSGLGRNRVQPRYNGGNLIEGAHYRVNEMGPENVYSGGVYTRDEGPATLSPNATGYVEPNTGTGPNGYPPENPGGVEGGYNFRTDPGYQFRFSEGMRALDRGAAAAGGLLSGGYGRRAVRYGQDYASQEYTNVYNRIANIAGLGQVSGGQNAQIGTAISGQVGGALSNAGAARGSGYVAQGNVWRDAIDSVARLPWGGGSSGGGSAVNPFAGQPATAPDWFRRGSGG